MATNWTANPPPQNEKGQTDSDRGMRTEWDYSDPDRQTGRTGKSASMVPNSEPSSEVYDEVTPGK